MSNPTPPNPSSNGKQRNDAPSAPRPPAGIHQSHSFSSYHHHPSAYYYHGHSPYPQQSQVSPMSVQYNTPPPPPPSHHPAYSPYHHHPRHPHHHRGQHQHGHHSPVTATNSTTPWPAPPPSSSSYAEGEKMDMSPGGGRGGGQCSLPPSPPVAMGSAPVVADTSALATLANASAASSAGPLKKRRKVDKKKMDRAEERDASADADTGAVAVPRDSESESPASMESSSPTNTNGSTHGSNSDNEIESNSSGLAYDQFPSLLHKLLCKGVNSDDRGKGDNDEKEDGSDKPASTTGAVISAISSAIEWLPHGRGFRVLRWDTLCTEVLPKEFPQLCDGIASLNSHADIPRQEEDAVDDRDDKHDPATLEEKNEPSDAQWTEAFLWHAKAWGFEEVTSGVDRGSFRHQLFVRETAERCIKMHRRRSGTGQRVFVATTPALAPYRAEIGHTSSFDVEHNNVIAAQPSWSKSHKVVSSIFKPRRRGSSSPHSGGPYNYNNHQHPSHLHVPVLGSSATASFADPASWGGGSSGGEHHHHRCPRSGSVDYPGGSHQHTRQYPHHHHGFPPPHPNTSMTRSPKTIRFRDDPPEELPLHHREDIAVEITPNPAEASPPMPRSKKTTPLGFHRGFVSRRGRRPALISRHATH